MEKEEVKVYLTLAVKDKFTHEWSIKKEKIEIDRDVIEMENSIKDHLDCVLHYNSFYEDVIILDELYLYVD